MVIYREMITPDGTRLVSRHVHDYVTHLDKNGKTYMLDGGHTGYYYRLSMNGDEKFFEIKLDSPFNLKREYMERYNIYSKDYVKIKDMSNDWVQNLIDWLEDHNYWDTWLYRLFIEEKLYRAENEIYVPDQLKLEFT